MKGREPMAADAGPAAQRSGGAQGKGLAMGGGDAAWCSLWAGRTGSEGNSTAGGKRGQAAGGRGDGEDHFHGTAAGGVQRLTGARGAAQLPSASRPRMRLREQQQWE